MGNEPLTVASFPFGNYSKVLWSRGQGPVDAPLHPTLESPGCLLPSLPHVTASTVCVLCHRSLSPVAMGRGKFSARWAVCVAGMRGAAGDAAKGISGAGQSEGTHLACHQSPGRLWIGSNHFMGQIQPTSIGCRHLLCSPCPTSYLDFSPWRSPKIFILIPHVRSADLSCG